LSFQLNGVPTTAPLTVAANNGLVSNGTTSINFSDAQTLTVGEFPLIAYSGSTISTGFLDCIVGRSISRRGARR